MINMHSSEIVSLELGGWGWGGGLFDVKYLWGLNDLFLFDTCFFFVYCNAGGIEQGAYKL